MKDYLDASEPYFAVGEYWDSLSYTYGEMDHNQDVHRQRIVDWINATNGTAGAFDVTTKGILHSVSFHLIIWLSNLRHMFSELIHNFSCDYVYKKEKFCSFFWSKRNIALKNVIRRELQTTKERNFLLRCHYFCFHLGSILNMCDGFNYKNHIVVRLM